jgi:hypothetical protein
MSSRNQLIKDTASDKSYLHIGDVTRLVGMIRFRVA